MEGVHTNQETRPMQAIEDTFKRVMEEGKPVFMPFVMGGYPTYENSIDIALTLQEAGAHILEIGLPYSDPLADGPTIQHASDVALKQGVTLSKGFQLIADMRKAGVTVPLIIFGYFNPILQFGFTSFIQEAIEVGANGVIIPDLPFEESAEIREMAKEKHFAYISLIAPNSRRRIQEIARQAEGFIYCISSLGVTGARDTFSNQIEDYLEEVRLHAHVPLAVGFGVSRKEHVQYFKQKADGIIIASALIDHIRQRLELYQDPNSKKSALLELKTFVEEMFSE
jgi:tryptophan synthase alpha chain